MVDRFGSLEPDSELFGTPQDLFGSTIDLQEDTGETFLILPSRTGGDAQNPFDNLPELQEVTAEDLVASFEDSEQLQDTFGSADNYISFVSEMSPLLEELNWTQNVAVQQYEEGSPEWIVANGMADEYSWNPGERERIESEIFNTNRATGSKALTSFWKQPEVTSLLQEYGINPMLTNSDGDSFVFTGTGYQKSFKENSPDLANFAKAAFGTALSIVGGPQLAAALTPTLGAAGAAAASSAILSSASQAITTGSVDPASVIKSAIASAIGTEALEQLTQPKPILDASGAVTGYEPSLLDQLGDYFGDLASPTEGFINPNGDFVTSLPEGIDPTQVFQGNVPGWQTAVKNPLFDLPDIPDWVAGAAEGVAGIIGGIGGGGGGEGGSSVIVPPESPQEPSEEPVEENQGDTITEVAEPPEELVEPPEEIVEPVEQPQDVTEAPQEDPVVDIGGQLPGDATDPEAHNDDAIVEPFPGIEPEPNFNDTEDKPNAIVDIATAVSSLSSGSGGGGGMLSGGLEFTPGQASVNYNGMISPLMQMGQRTSYLDELNAILQRSRQR